MKNLPPPCKPIKNGNDNGPNKRRRKRRNKPPRKLRLGLMLHAGAGQKLEGEVRNVAVNAAKAFESAGAT